MKKISIVFFQVFLAVVALAQVTTNPDLPVASKSVTIYFDSSKESRLGFFTGDLYAHTGVMISGNSNWQHVIGSWGNNTLQPKLTNKGNGMYELAITPDISTFYSVTASEKVLKLAFVFRSADGSKQTNDLFVTVYEEGLVVDITEPLANAIVVKNQAVQISAKSTAEAELKLYVNQTQIAQASGKEIKSTYTFSQSGNYQIFASATSGSVTKKDTIDIVVRDDTPVQTKPSAYKKGINYLTDNSVALVLFAPKKEFVFVTGDFNNWKIQNSYLMKKDGDYFWLEINNLEKGKEYIFQYLIDGKIKIADPYTRKTSDPWNDKYISSATYPGLIAYPAGKTDGMASVLQTGQTPFAWGTNGFKIPENSKLVIYELLIRDFMTDHSFKAVREKLDYLKDLNINVLELMPVNEFEGNSSWGYNPSFYFAPDKYYGPEEELKKLVDECHKRGIAVVIDMVLNHSFGQSPFVQMYMNNWTITADNPWYNVTSPNPVYSWGYDFNHESQVVKELVDSVNSFWINEFRVDGFRFDFTKGFTNTPGDGWAYDASRIAILKRMSGEIWKRKPGALVIIEHLAENREEKELAELGILLWGNLNGNYRNAAKGDIANSNLNWGVYNNRGWGKAGLVTYAESHDEERVMTECLSNGYQNGTYNTRELPVALDRVELNEVFHIPLPGPKMIWQFGERGYDVSINSYGGRLGEKPPRWEYLGDKDRIDLFKTVSKLNYLKINESVFNPETFSYDLIGDIKWYSLSKGSEHVMVFGNFGLQLKTASVTFPDAGKWYEYFTGDSIMVYNVQQNFSLSPGQYKFFTTKKLAVPKVITHADKIADGSKGCMIYPNPAQNVISLVAAKPVDEVEIFSVNGEIMFSKKYAGESALKIETRNFKNGIYFIQVKTGNEIYRQKVTVLK